MFNLFKKSTTQSVSKTTNEIIEEIHETFYTEAEKYHYNKKLPRIGEVKEPLKKRLKIAMFENFSEGQQGYMDEDTWRVQVENAKLLEALGHTVEIIKVQRFQRVSNIGKIEAL